MLKTVMKMGLVALFCLALFTGGCDSISSNKEQRIRRYSHIADVNRRLLTEDIEMTLLLDRPTTLSRWHIRN